MDLERCKAWSINLSSVEKQIILKNLLLIGKYARSSIGTYRNERYKNIDLLDARIEYCSMYHKSTISRIAGILSALVLFAFAYTEEITPFRITGVDGELFVQYYNDEYVSKNDGIETSRREGVTTQEGLDLTCTAIFTIPIFFVSILAGGRYSISTIMNPIW